MFNAVVVVEFSDNIVVVVNAYLYYCSRKTPSAAGTKEAADSRTMSRRRNDISGREAQF